MKNIEYTRMAYLYDKFYSKKNYEKEVEFICNFIQNKNAKILDAGCGTGNHAKLLFEMGYDITGFDKSSDMIDIANSKIPNHFFVDDLLSLRTNKKYDLIISFFAVFNHLKSYTELKQSLINLKNHLEENGTIIIDLHNPQKSGKKIENIENATRIMKWNKCKLLQKEFTKITYVIDNEYLTTRHVFKIFNISKLSKIAKEIGFKCIQFHENYNTTSTASNKSKNIQMILKI